MDKQEIFSYLQQENIWHEITKHEAVFSMDDAISVELPYPECDAKNLFVRDDKKKNYYMITVCGPKRVDLKAFRQAYGTRRLSFASAEELWHMIQIKPGSVSPLGLLQNRECNVKLYLDEDFFHEPGIIGIHPNDNTATVWLKAVDLRDLIEKHGNDVEVVELPQLS